MGTPPANSNKNSKLPTPFSLRLTFEERATLEKTFGGLLSRSITPPDTDPPRKVRTRTRQPLKDDQALGSVLGKLGKSRLANNLTQLAKAANTGSFAVTPDTEKVLQDACGAVQENAQPSKQLILRQNRAELAMSVKSTSCVRILRITGI